MKTNTQVNLALATIVFAIYAVGQIYMGTRAPSTGAWTFSTPIDEDIFYYAAIANQIAMHIPPQNPAYAGVHLFQSWLPMVPVASLMPVFGAYVAMKLLNLGYLLALAYLLRRYFPERWGIALLILCVTLGLKYKVHSFGLDAIFKGFYHLPSYIAFLVILFEKRHAWLRFPCLLVLPWLHALTSIPVFLFLSVKLLVDRDRRSLESLMGGGAGLIIYAFFFSNPDATPGYMLLLEGLSFNPLEAILHVLVWAMFFPFCRNRDLWILFVTTFLWSTLMQWEPFPWIYMLEFCIALMVVDALPNAPLQVRRFFPVVVSITAVSFVLYASLVKFSRDTPIDPAESLESMEWVLRHTPQGAVFAIAPPVEVNKPQDQMPPIMAHRTVYYGPQYLVKAVGLDPDGSRSRKNLRIFSEGIVPKEVDFIFYGPAERTRFPNFPGVGHKVYEDTYVTIYGIRSSAFTPNGV